MRLLWGMGLVAAFGSGCVSLVDLSVEEIQPQFKSAYADTNVKGKKIAVAAVRVERDLERDRWFRRKLSAAVEGLVIGVIPYPWDLRAWYGPCVIEADSTFPGDGNDPKLAEAVVKALGERGAEATVLDASAAVDGASKQISVKRLVAAAKAAGAEAVYIVAYNQFTNLRFKSGEDKKGEEIFHEVYKVAGNVYAPSVAVFAADGTRLLARARTFETIFYAPLFTWGWMTPFEDDSKFKETVTFLGEVSGRDDAEASTKTAAYLVKRDFGGEPPAPKDATKEARLAPTGAPTRG